VIENVEAQGATAPRVALIFQPMSADARLLAEKCGRSLSALGYDVRQLSAWELSPAMDNKGVRMAITFGGDGTIIRAARWLAGNGTPILGVAMGKLGFLTELAPESACDRLPHILAGDYWVDERLMVGARVHPVKEAAESRGPVTAGESPVVDVAPMLALNEVVIGRGVSPKVVDIDVMVDGVHLVHYVADALILATPTGSTAYALSAGGPVLAPGVQGLLLVPLAAHLAVLKSLVVPLSARIDVRAASDQPLLMVLDGQEQIPLRSHQLVTVEIARERALFARTGSRSSFYETLVQSYNKKR
jgi:NAD+ kinase